MKDYYDHFWFDQGMMDNNSGKFSDMNEALKRFRELDFNEIYSYSHGWKSVAKNVKRKIGGIITGSVDPRY